MEKHYRKIVQDTDERVVFSLGIQELDENDSHYGGFYDKNYLVEAKFAIYRIASMIAAYCNEDSRFYHDELIGNRILLGLTYVRSVQHENGLFDYISCNFNSAPDTAFCTKKLMPVFEYLSNKDDITNVEQQIRIKVSEIVKSGAYGLLEGGFHTPNHRWAIASMIAKAGALFEDETLKKACWMYLNEGIDCNKDGEFAEKSAGNYNRINNDAMITLTESLGDPQYEQYAVKNLHMMLTYIEPDGSVFTANSTRFDKDFLIFPKDYYLEYLNMGIKHNIPEFLGMCNTIFDIVEMKKISSPDFLIWFMLHPEYRTFEYEERYVIPEFTRYYEESGILRAKAGKYSYTVMRNKSNFLYFHDGTIKLAMKVAGSFCEHRAFIPETMEIGQDGVIYLHQTMHGWYYLPLEEKQETSDWWKMDQSKRKKKMGPDMDVDVFITPVKGGLDVRVKTSGVDGAPWRVEIAFQGISYIAADHVMLPVNGSEVLVMKDKEIDAYNQKDGILVGPGFGAHRFTDGKEDSETKTSGAATIYFTDYTAFDHIIQIRNKADMYTK